MDAAEAAVARRVVVIRVTVRCVLLVLGLGLVAWLIASAGAERVLDTMSATRGAIGLVALLEVGVLACDALAVNTLLGDRGALSRRTWLRGTALAYASATMLPSGRAAGEAVRAATFTAELGAVQSTYACVLLQAFALLANGAISSVGAMTTAVCLPGNRLLVWALSANAAACGAIGAALLFVSHRAHASGWLLRWVARIARNIGGAHPSFGVNAQLGAFACCASARLLQTLEYGVLVHAVGRATSPVLALAAQGIHLVVAAVGDFVPAQRGVSEAAYRAFARTLFLQTKPASVLSIALAPRLAQLPLCAICILFGGLVAPQARRPAR